MGAAGIGVAIPSGFGTVLLAPPPELSLRASVDPDGRWTRAVLDLLPPSTAPPIA
jgi:hypothetical protein